MWGLALSVATADQDGMTSKHRITVGEELRYDADVSGLRGLSGTYAQPANVSDASGVRLPFVGVRDPQFGAKGDGVTDDTAAIQAALNAAAAWGSTQIAVYFPPGVYMFTSLTWPSQVVVQGAGRRATVLKRSANVVGITMIGTSLASLWRDSTIRDMMIHGGDFSADLIQQKYCSTSRFVDLDIRGVGGRLVYMQVGTQDNRWLNCMFTFGGTSDGATPVIEMNSGGGTEPVNQIMFMGCHWESNRAEAIRSTGSNTNEIYAYGCKAEHYSGTSVSPILNFSNSIALHIDGFQIAFLGAASSSSLNGLIAFTNCQDIHLVTQAEVAGSSGMTTDYIVYLDATCTNAWIAVYLEGVASKVVRGFGIGGTLASTIDGFFKSIPATAGISGTIPHRIEGGRRVLTQANTQLPAYESWAQGDRVWNTSISGTPLMGSVVTASGASQGGSWASGQTYTVPTWRVGGSNAVYALVTAGPGVTANQPTHAAGAGDNGTDTKAYADGYSWRYVASGGVTLRNFGTIVGNTANTLTVNGSQAWNASSGDSFQTTLQANITSSSITGGVGGQLITIALVQDATGGRTYVWPTNCKFAGGVAPSDTTASKRTTVTFRYDGTNWNEISRSIAVG